MTVLASDIYANYRESLLEELNKSEKLCGADLVTFVIDGDVNALENADSAECIKESIGHKDNTCWCGKFQNGKQCNLVTPIVG